MPQITNIFTSSEDIWQRHKLHVDHKLSFCPDSSLFSCKDDPMVIFGLEELREPILLVSGKVGCGKTFAAKMLLDLLCTPTYLDDGSVGIIGQFLRASDLSRICYPWKGEVDDDFRPPDPKYENSVWLIDDLGSENLTKRWMTDFEKFIDERISGSNQLTIITTNLPPEELKSVYSLRAVDRINGSCQVVKMKGGTRRPNKGGLR